MIADVVIIIGVVRIPDATTQGLVSPTGCGWRLEEVFIILGEKER
jgi:hypothetical protein